jgi:Ca-activated chloride channel family protein
VVILLSDGVDTTGSVDPAAAAAIAKTLGVRIHTIALGPDDLETAPQSRDAVDAATLRAIAENSGGRMFRVHDVEELAAVGDAINALEPSPSSAPPMRVWRDFWTWPAGAAFALTMLALGLGRRAA